MKSTILAIAFLLVSATSSLAQTSPDGSIALTTTENGIAISYRHHGALLPVLTLHANQAKASYDARGITSVSYDMLTGKKRHCTNSYSTVTCTDANGDDIVFRLFNDGIAFRAVSSNRYSVAIPSQNNWLMTWHDSYEDFFHKNRITRPGDRLAYPALFEYQSGLFALLSESCICKDNAATSIFATDIPNEYSLQADGAESGGWQTMIIGTLADVVESTLINDNSEPCQLKDTSWIRPGMASWVYWAYNHGSKDYDIICRYVDMAYYLHLPYVLIDAEWDEMPAIASNNGKTIEDAVAYALKRGIRPMIWYNSSVGWVNGAPSPKYRLNKPEDREREFAWCEKIGVKGVKIDFFSGDTNMNQRYMIELLECAARHHLLVNFHGAPIPRGWQRTYPNLISTEGVYGAEWYNNVPTFTVKAASHNATLPFTRNVVGSMDYTPCAWTDSQHPHITSYAHELALTTVFESGIQHLADRPESFLAQPLAIRNYISSLPTAWDETRFLYGYPGVCAVIARRKGRVWYIAGINGNDTPITITLQLNRLKNLGKRITMIEDSQDMGKHWKITSRRVHNNTSITLLPRGGFVMTSTE